MPRLEVDAQGRVVGPNVVYGTPWPSPNGRYGFHEPARGMASHTEVGWEHNVIHEFEDPSSQASAFFSIGFGGTITQYGPIGKGWMAWTQAAGNPYWRAVEHEDGGDPNNPYTASQIEASASLLELQSRVDGFPIQATDDPVGGRGNIFHSDGGAAWGGHDCPGNVRRGQRPLVVARALEIRNGVPRPVPAPLVHEFKEDTTVKSALVTIPLAPATDPNAGRGWKNWDPGYGRAPVLVACYLQGPDPRRDGWNWPKEGTTVSGQVSGNEVIAVVKGGDPGAQVGVYISVA